MGLEERKSRLVLFTLACARSHLGTPLKCIFWLSTSAAGIQGLHSDRPPGTRGGHRPHGEQQGAASTSDAALRDGDALSLHRPVRWPLDMRYSWGLEMWPARLQSWSFRFILVHEFKLQQPRVAIGYHWDKHRQPVRNRPSVGHQEALLGEKREQEWVATAGPS